MMVTGQWQYDGVGPSSRDDEPTGDGGYDADEDGGDGGRDDSVDEQSLSRHLYQRP